MTRSPSSARTRFAITFAAIAGVAFLAYTFPYGQAGISEHWFSSYLALYARVAGAALALFEPGITVTGQDILGRFNLRIVKNCDAMEANILYASAVLAFPAPLRARLAGVAGGVLLLVALNVVRICSLYYVGLFAPRSFPFFHLELWPVVLVGAGAGLFLAWASHAGPRGSDAV